MAVEMRHSLRARMRMESEKAIDEAYLAARRYEPWESFEKAKSVLLEEVYQLVQELDSAQVWRVKENLHTEAVQVASIALRIAAIATVERARRLSEGA
jgi:hypothetical protein